MTADELQSLLTTLDSTVQALERDDPIDAGAIVEAIKPQLAVVREAYTRASRIEAMGDSE